MSDWVAPSISLLSFCRCVLDHPLMSLLIQRILRLLHPWDTCVPTCTINLVPNERVIIVIKHHYSKCRAIPARKTLKLICNSEVNEVDEQHPENSEKVAEATNNLRTSSAKDPKENENSQINQNKELLTLDETTMAVDEDPLHPHNTLAYKF